ncbi:MAG: Crp/Fnr family transcriptional regulator [Bacillota bacterium]|nr:Crp/Fnr family transcriptional regulator [Bacillota bacterium]
MEERMKTISGFSLFEGIRQEDLAPMLSCLGGYFRDYRKGAIIALAEEPAEFVGCLLSGTVHMIQEDLWGNKTILSLIRRGELFGETFVCGSNQNSKVTLQAAEDTEVLCLPFYKILHSCNMSCVFHHRLIENMVQLIADRNWFMMEKMEILSKKNLREKILSYLSLQAQQQESKYFQIPLGRTELAEYLSADRSALSRELSRMKRDGWIDFEGDTFRLLK